MSKLVDECKERIKQGGPRVVPLPSSSRKASSCSLDYDMIYCVPNTKESDPKKRKGMSSTLESSFNNKGREACNVEIARLFYTSGLSFNVARNPHYRFSYLRASYILGYVALGYNALRTRLLHKERKNVEMHLQSLKDSWIAKSVSICSDGWSDPQRRPIFNMIAANKSGPMMLREINSQGEMKIGEKIAEMIIECIEEVGHENVVQVVTDNASNCVRAGSLISAKFASTVVMSKRFQKIKTGLQQMVISPKWDDYKENNVERAYAVKQKLLDEMFWDEFDYVLSFTLSIYSVIRAANTDIPSLHLAYECSLEQEYYPSSLHGTFSKYYSSEWLREKNTRKAPHQDLTVTRERKSCIMKYYMNQDERREVNVEYSNFSLCLEDFSSMDAMHDRFILEPLKRWAVHGASAPKLQALAFKLLGQLFSSSCCEKNWSTYKFIHYATRNKITPQRAENLVFVHTNLRLFSRRSLAYKCGRNHMWDVGGDQFDSLDETNLGRLEFEDLSLDEPELEAVLFDRENEIEHEDDDLNL